MLVPLDRRRSFFFVEKAMGCGEVLRSDRYAFVRIRLNVEEPIAVRTEPIGHDNLRTSFSVLDNFEYGVTPDDQNVALYESTARNAFRTGIQGASG